MKKGYKIFTEDEAAMVQGVTRMKTWAPRGKGVTAPSFLSKKRFHMFGALSKDEFVCKFHDKADKHSMIKFLGTPQNTRQDSSVYRQCQHLQITWCSKIRKRMQGRYHSQILSTLHTAAQQDWEPVAQCPEVYCQQSVWFSGWLQKVHSQRFERREDQDRWDERLSNLITTLPIRPLFIIIFGPPAEWLVWGIATGSPPTGRPRSSVQSPLYIIHWPSNGRFFCKFGVWA